MLNPLSLSFAIPLIGLAALADVVFAQPNPDTGPGCGLGKVVWEDWKGQKQILPQMSMATTNVTGSYSFAIASGTSGCSHDGRILDSQKASLFIDVNYESLAEDMARGGGEHLASLAVLMQVPQEYHGEFFQAAKDQYAFVTAEGERTPALMEGALHRAMADHPILARLSRTN